MEEKKNIFVYLEQTFTIFGITVMLLSAFGKVFGESARDISTLFRMGAEGIATETLLQFLLVSAVISFLRFLFFTDVVFRKQSITGRMVAMLGAIVILIVLMTICFGWFPVDMWEPWALFFLCFGGSFGVSLAVTIWKEKLENKKMAEALEKMKRMERSKKDE